MAARRGELFKAGLATLAIALAGVGLWRFFSDSGGVSEKGFFYDESQGELFVAARDLIPPIAGRDGPAEDAVRAVVVSTTGEPADRDTWKIAYLEKYSPELKAQMEAARSAGASPEMGRGGAQAHRWVRRVSDTNWFPLTSAEGEEIVMSWIHLGIDGKTPVVCVP